MTTQIDITGVDKGALLAELFNNSRVMGMGILQAGRGPDVMTHGQGRELIARTLGKEFAHDNALMFGRLDGRLYFDYLFGRPLKVDISGDRADPCGYDCDNGGEGTFAAIVDKVRGAQLTSQKDPED